MPGVEVPTVDPVAPAVSTSLGDTDMEVLSEVKTCSSLPSAVGAVPVSNNRKLTFHFVLYSFH